MSEIDYKQINRDGALNMVAYWQHADWLNSPGNGNKHVNSLLIME